MKTELTIISDDLNHGVIDEKKARTLLLDLFGVSGSLFYQKVEKLVNEWKEKELGETHPFSPEAEIEAGMKYFLRWLKEQNIQ